MFQGDRGLRIKTSIGGMVLLGKIMLLQGVRHPISCLGVCHPDDPQKEGLYGVRVSHALFEGAPGLCGVPVGVH